MPPAVLRSAEAVGVLECISLISAGDLDFLVETLEISAFILHMAVSTVLLVPAPLCWEHTANRWRDLKKWAAPWVSIYQSWFNLCNSPVSHENLLYSGTERQICTAQAHLSCSKEGRSAAGFGGSRHWAMLLRDTRLLLTDSKMENQEEMKIND